ncbi:Histidinol phosphatase and related hydrolases of the PHP family, partial [hydrothermal vent metagenome]
ARLGGFWDSMLGEGRRWWIIAGSDSHHHYTEGGKDFWPGEYSKTYVYAEKNYDDILMNMRAGHIFVTTGDLVSELYVRAEIVGQSRKAAIGETLEISKGDNVRITVTFLDPETPNANGQNSRVGRVDLITGLITGKVKDKNTDVNPTTVVIGRYGPGDWQVQNGYKSFSYILGNVIHDRYIRVRGTNTSQLEPQIDIEGENPWDDLWFYSNPVFIKVH